VTSRTGAPLGLTALLLGIAFLFMGGGLSGVLIPVRAALEGYTTLQIGLLGTGAAVGTIIGCVLAPGLILRVGHIRAFAVLAATAAIVALVHGLVLDPWVWILLRVPTGIAFAGLATVAESWLNASSGNDDRGRTMAVYMMVQLAMLTAGQLLLMTADPMLLNLFALIALLVTASLIPVGLTRAAVPGPVASVRLNLGGLYRQSPSGVIGALAIGLANGAVWALAPLYAADRGFDPAQIAIFMSLAVIGGAVLQYPLGRWSDRVDRRYVILVTSVAAGLIGFALAWLQPGSSNALMALAAGLGAFIFALYPLCVAHVNDHVGDSGFVEACSSMLLLYGAGAVVGPVIAAVLMDRAGSGALFAFTAFIHALLVLFTLTRLRASPRPVASDREDFVAMPANATRGLDLDPRSTELDADDPVLDGLSASADKSGL
jgi:MFS family permease